MTEPAKKTNPTREECIADFIRLQNATPDTPVRRLDYRKRGKFLESDWARYFVRFGDFQEAAHKVAIAEGTADPEPTKEDFINDLLRVHHEQEEGATRQAYRKYGKYTDGEWITHFTNFSKFLAAAGIEERGTKKTAKEQVAEDLIFKENYTYNAATDTYITFLRTLGTNIVLSGERHRALLQRYSSMVDKASTINEICRDFQMPRSYFIAYKTAHGWTHDMDPFTKEDHVSRPTDDLVAEAEQLSRFKVQKEFQKRSWAKIQSDANKWADFEHSVLEPLTAAIDKIDLPKVTPTLKLAKPTEPYALVVNPYDAHFGKSGWQDETGESYSREECRSLIMEHTQRLAEQVSKFGRPEKIIVASGSDWFHIDNPDSKTTGGTPQDCDGSYAQILTEGCELAKDQLEFLRQIAPVEFFTAPGNHDRYSALTLSIFLKAYYRGASDVQILSSPLPRQYVLYGNSLLGFGHGDSVKVGDLHGIMTQEAPDLWKKSDNRYYFTGHFHHKMVEEIHGITRYQLSSLSGADRWHKQKGYVTSSRALQAFMLTKGRGITAEFISPVNHGKGLRGVKMSNKNR